jgi:hypothetical protein
MSGERSDAVKPVTPKELLKWFMEAKRSDVFFNFAGLEGAVGSQEDGYVFVPGSLPPERRPLLVAHADTVWDKGDGISGVRVKWDGGVATADNWKVGLGADDRAGVAMLWLLKKSGASILLTDDEEIGCLGARAAVAEGGIADLLKEHIFGVQMDRRGDCQAVFYSAASPEFEKWLVEALQAGTSGGEWWRKKHGSFSDVAVLGRELELNCVNLSAGFLYEHTKGEMLFYDAWDRSVEAVKHLVALAEAGEVPEMPGPKKYTVYNSYRGGKFAGKRSYWRNGRWVDENGVPESEDDPPHGGFQPAGVREAVTDFQTQQARSQPWKAQGLTEEAYWRREAKEKEWPQSWLDMMLENIAAKSAKVAQNGKPAKKAKSQVLEFNAKDALLPFDWKELSRAERQAACKEAEATGIELVQSGQWEPSEMDATEAYWMFVIESARFSGLISPEAATMWEHRLVFSQDDSDPRVMAFARGGEWAEGLSPTESDALEDYYNGLVH